MTKTIEFHPRADVESKKRAINRAMQTEMPFELKQVMMTVPDHGQMEYTGGRLQMILATAATLNYVKRCVAS